MRTLDLHHRRLPDVLPLFLKQFELCSATRAKVGLNILHGYGSTGYGGSIRLALRKLLDYLKYCKVLDYSPGEVTGNPGQTIVYPNLRLAEQPPHFGQSLEALWAGLSAEARKRINLPHHAPMICDTPHTRATNNPSYLSRATESLTSTSLKRHLLEYLRIRTNSRGSNAGGSK